MIGIGLFSGDAVMPERGSIARYLKEYRQRNKMTQFEFSEDMGISIEELSLLERELVNPSLGTLQKIAAYTGISVAELVYVKSEEENEKMYRFLLHTYFVSYEYSKHEKSEAYMEFSGLLENYTEEEVYLELEEKLNAVIVQIAENAFLAGCEAAAKCKCRF